MFLSSHFGKRLAMVAPLYLLTLNVALADSIASGFDAFRQGDYQGALSAWLVDAEQGDATAQFNVGQLYRLGKGVEQDYQQAAHWYQQAARQGYSPAERNLQLLVADGHIASVEADHPGGNPDAMAARSRSEPGLTAYQQGDFNGAIDAWLPLAAEGDVTAQFNLGQLYRLGKGVAQDDAQAVRWYRRAALQGHPMAMHNLRVMLEQQRIPGEQQQGISAIVSGGSPKPDALTSDVTGSNVSENIPNEVADTAAVAAPPAAPPAALTVPKVEMLSRPLIAGSQPPAPHLATTPEPATESPQVSEPLAIPESEPPVPRQRPEQEIEGTVTAAGPRFVAPSMINAPRAPQMPSVPSVPSVSMPESVRVPAVVAEAAPDATPQATPQATPEAAKPEQSFPGDETNEITRTAAASGGGRALSVAERLDLTSLVVEAETVPVSTVAAVSDAAPVRVESAEVITVAALDTSPTLSRTVDTGNVTSIHEVTPSSAASVDILHENAWFQTQDAEAYVIQIMASNRRAHLEKFLAGIEMPAEPVILVSTIRGERPWYVLLLGPYPGYSVAADVLAELNAPLKVNGPWIRRVGKIQSVMR